MKIQRLIALACCLGGATSLICGTTQAANKPELLTSWGEAVAAGQTQAEYPRPGLRRDNWMSLNGKWNYIIRTLTGPYAQPQSGTILVPFPVESALSGVQHQFNHHEELEYNRTFSIPSKWRGQRIWLHFDAVNWESEVRVNDKLVGRHRGGYDRFGFDITDFLEAGSEQRISVRVHNPGEFGRQPRGKQTFTPHGIWYTSSSGIWQTVWLEPVAPEAIADLALVSQLGQQSLGITANVTGDTNGLTIVAIAFAAGTEVGTASGVPGTPFALALKQLRVWNPDDPFLYDLKVVVQREGRVVDEVSSYFGMREISVEKDSEGLPRINLNHHPLFQVGVLDQGYWPDGVYTPPNDAAIQADVAMMRKLGFNMCRKHVKIESDRWYYWCDKLGLLVWQDFPSSGVFAPKTAKDIKRSPEELEQLRTEMKAMVRQHRNDPAVVLWIAFNEGWGQTDTTNMVQLIKQEDPSRLVIGASGWNDRGVGDLLSLHLYPGPALPEFKDNRAVVCGECGGFGLPVTGHLWPVGLPWSYTFLNSPEQLKHMYTSLFERIHGAYQQGLSGVVITQFTDVETEVNGLVTYDRKYQKLDRIPQLSMP